MAWQNINKNEAIKSCAVMARGRWFCIPHARRAIQPFFLAEWASILHLFHIPPYPLPPVAFRMNLNPHCFRSLPQRFRYAIPSVHNTPISVFFTVFMLNEQRYWFRSLGRPWSAPALRLCDTSVAFMPVGHSERLAFLDLAVEKKSVNLTLPKRACRLRLDAATSEMHGLFPKWLCEPVASRGAFQKNEPSVWGNI